MKKNTKGLDKLLKSLRQMNGMKVKWGFFEDSQYQDPRGIESVAEVAALVEHGHDNGGMFPNTTTPPRPFFETATTDAENHRAVRALIKKLQRKVLQGKIDPTTKLEAVGRLLVEQVQESILNFSDPKLEESTIAVREWRYGTSWDDPLIESGTLFDSVEYKVESA